MRLQNRIKNNKKDLFVDVGFLQENSKEPTYKEKNKNKSFCENINKYKKKM